ncbi:MAG: AtpZ/AtpI family protein [Ignavibacteriales bacterium]|nr:AtpZ/AtpI family protein [Ignavibacteriales bacterium]
MKQAENDPEKGKSIYKDIGPMLGMGVNLAATIVLFVYAGNWLDKHFEKKDPFYLLICAGIGLFSGMYHFIKTALQLEKKSKK